MVQTLHKSANILHVYIHKYVLTMFQQMLMDLHASVHMVGLPTPC